MVTIRGWLKQGFDPKKSENCRHIPECGSGSERMVEQNHLFGLSLYYEGVAGRWYFDLRKNPRFEVCEAMAALVEEWSLEEYYPNPGVGLTPIIYGLDGKPGTARLAPATNGRDVELMVTKCPTIADLEALYLAVRRGEAKVVEVWDGKPKRPDPRDEQIAQMQSELNELEKRIETVTAAERARAEKAEQELGECRTDLRLLQEDVCRMIRGVWEDMCHVSWWRSKRYLMRMVCNAMRANARAFRCADGFVASQAIKAFSRED